MTNFTHLITLLATFAISYGADDICHVDQLLMLPAPEDVYHKQCAKEVFPNATILPSIFVNAPVPVFFENITIPSVLDTPKLLKTFEYNEEDFSENMDDSQDSDDVIHMRCMKIAGFVAQCIIFLFVFTIVTMDVEHFDYPEEAQIFVVHKLHKAQEIQTCPLPTIQNVQIIKRELESEC
ncbi:hypothetical protein CRE_12485 [Caenorhabditis remanei]|uniref:Uncharacterized protein n=1 Tax=Caenorhabditis remanei TaxID=31234 RepID=E3M758_CAERE|nr:hypothetical protein CRE_12485 [Caenorhabditis remanei]